MLSLTVVVACAALAAEPEPESAPELQSHLRAVQVRPEVGTGIFGHELTFNLGVTSAGIQSRGDGRLLLSWNGRAEAAAGLIVYEHPFFPIYGARAQAEAEAGYRLWPTAPWSPYAGVRLGLLGSAIAESLAPLSQVTHINNGGDLLGWLGDLQLCLGAGASRLALRHSLLLEASLLFEGDTARADLPARAFFGGVLRARYDVAARLAAIGEAWYAVTPDEHNAALASTSQTNRWGLSLELRYLFGTHVLTSLGFHLVRDETDVTYAGGLRYPTAPPIEALISIGGGYAP